MHKVKVAINRSWKDKAIHFDDNIPDDHPDWARQGNISKHWVNVQIDPPCVRLTVAPLVSRFQ